MSQTTTGRAPRAPIANVRRQSVLPGNGCIRVELAIDGATASRPGRAYGFYEAGVEIQPGSTTVLPCTIWQPRLDTRNTVTIPAITTREVVLTTPRIPGLEVHIPAGNTITGEDGRPVMVLGITAIPVDRPPFPPPANVEVPIYFTVQPGGAYVSSKNAYIVYPNYHEDAPGARGSF